MKVEFNFKKRKHFSNLLSDITYDIRYYKVFAVHQRQTNID